MIAQPPCDAPISAIRAGSTKGIRRASSMAMSTSPARSEPMRTCPAQTSRQRSCPASPRGPWLSTTTAAQPIRVQPLRPALHVVARPVAAGEEERGRKRPRAFGLQHPVGGREHRRQRIRLQPRHRPAAIARRARSRPRRPAPAPPPPRRRRATATTGAAASSLRRREVRLEAGDLAGRPARRIGHRHPGVDVVLRRVVVAVPDRHQEPDRHVEPELQERHDRIPAQLRRHVRPHRRVHPLRLVPERVRVEEGDRIAGVLQDRRTASAPSVAPGMSSAFSWLVKRITEPSP